MNIKIDKLAYIVNLINRGDVRAIFAALMHFSNEERNDVFCITNGVFLRR